MKPLICTALLGALVFTSAGCDELEFELLGYGPAVAASYGGYSTGYYQPTCCQVEYQEVIYEEEYVEEVFYEPDYGWSDWIWLP